MLYLKLVLGLLAIVFFALQFHPELLNSSKLMVNLSALCVLLFAITDPVSMLIVNSKSSFSFPSLSTFTSHNERLTLSNYSSKTVSYEIVVSADEMTKLTPKNITGKIAPNSNITLKTVDIVVTTGSTKFSALVNISAPVSMVDAMITRLDLATGQIERINSSK